MATKTYDWASGAPLEDHTGRKHKIIREYFYSYMVTRCQLPQQERFRLCVVDGFAGGGRYKHGEPGSPLIFLEELGHAFRDINIGRMGQSLSPLSIECLLVLNDADPKAVELLRSNTAPVVAKLRQDAPSLHLRIEYLSKPFETAYSDIKSLVTFGRFRSVLFNLDQCGHSRVSSAMLREIMNSYMAPEIFYTFAIDTLISFLEKAEPARFSNQLKHLGLDKNALSKLEGEMNKSEWLGTAEKIVFNSFFECARYVSPFSINNPKGWQYWLIHFANSYRARQVYNNVLHGNSTAQAHFGRSGLNMLAYDPSTDGMLYLFDEEARANARSQLYDDIPRLIAESGDAISLAEFYESVFNATPAHSDDIHTAIIDNPDIEVVTPTGGERRKSNTISIGDVLKLRTQRSFFPMFGEPPKPKK